jgi:subtilisin-like proprotein convertase family protein
MSAPLFRRLAVAGAALVLSASAASAQTLLGNLTANGAGRSICDLCTVTSQITFAGPGSVLTTGNNVTVRINGFSHTYIGDLTARLTYTSAANGSTIQALLLPRRTGDGADINGTFSFNDGFATPVGSLAYTGGDFAPGTLGVFNGVDVAGTWTLTVADLQGQDVGAFQSWDIGLATTATTTTPEPGTWALMGTGLLGLAAAARRRRTA